MKYVSNGFCHGYVDICDEKGETMVWTTEEEARKWLEENSGYSCLEVALRYYEIKPYIF